MNHLSGTKNWEPGVCTSRRPHLGCPESLVLPLFSMQPRPKTEMLHGRAETYDNLCRKHFGCLRVVHSNLTSSSRSSLAMRSRHFRDWLILRAKEKSFHCWVMLEQDPNLWDTWGRVILLEGQRETLSSSYVSPKIIPLVFISFYFNMCPSLAWIIGVDFLCYWPCDQYLAASPREKISVIQSCVKFHQHDMLFFTSGFLISSLSMTESVLISLRSIYMIYRGKKWMPCSQKVQLHKLLGNRQIKTRRYNLTLRQLGPNFVKLMCCKGTENWELFLLMGTWMWCHCLGEVEAIH